MVSKINHEFDRLSELKAFDDTKTGVKGLADAGITEVPRIFRSPPDDSNKSSLHAADAKFSFPIIDLEGIYEEPNKRKAVVEKVRDASETWGFFQVVNHGIPQRILEEMLSGTRRFHEQDPELKKAFYTRDYAKRVVYNSNFNLYSAPEANWRDSLFCLMAPDPNPEELPSACRDELLDFSRELMNLGILLFELLSEALGLEPNYLKDMDCSDGLAVLCNYYPACPQPKLTLGASKHADSGFLTVLLQDQIGGLQILHQNQWVDVPPVPGTLVVNIADLLQLLSNDKFLSLEHRVVANHRGPRISVACFFSTFVMPKSKLHGPIKELLSEENPPKYRETTTKEYAAHYKNRVDDGSSALLHFRL